MFVFVWEENRVPGGNPSVWLNKKPLLLAVNITKRWYVQTPVSQKKIIQNNVG